MESKEGAFWKAVAEKGLEKWIGKSGQVSKGYYCKTPNFGGDECDWVGGSIKTLAEHVSTRHARHYPVFYEVLYELIPQ